MASTIATTFIDTVAAVSSLVNQLLQLPTIPPSIYVDLEGISLSRTGFISIITFLIHRSSAQQEAYLVDVHTLGHLAFSAPGTDGSTLKSILESASIPKIFFDVRNDSDALHAHFNIALQGVEDVQLMENASRGKGSKKLVNELANCVRFDARLGHIEKDAWEVVKERGERLFNPQKGGSYEIFNARPLPEGVKAYCVGDVRYLPVLRSLYWGKLTASWREKVRVETRNRIARSQRPDYQPHGQGRTLGPWPDEPTTIGKYWNQSQERDLDDLWDDFHAGYDDDDEYDWYDDGGNDYEDWTRAPWQGPPS